MTLNGAKAYLSPKPRTLHQSQSFLGAETPTRELASNAVKYQQPNTLMQVSTRQALPHNDTTQPPL
jgi:hypothetical protein